MPARVCIVRQRDYYELPVRREAESLRDAGYRVDVICLREPGKPAREIDNGIVLHRLAGTRKKTTKARYLFDYLAFFVRAAVKLTQLHLQQRFAVIQVNTMPDFLVFATVVPRLLGAKVVVFMKEPTPELARTLFGSARLARVLVVVEQLALRYAHQAFTVTQQLKDLYVSRGADASTIHVVLNGPDARHLTEVTPDPPAGAKEGFRFLCHGSVEEHYGHEVILRGLAKARGRLPDARLVITGSGAFENRVRQLIDELGLHDCVQYLGWVSMPRLAAELRDCDAGIVAQEANPYSHLVHTNKMYEYMIFDKPVIASRLEATASYFGDDAVRYFTPGDPSSLAEAMVDVATDPAARERMVVRAAELYERYRWEHQAERMVEVYRRLGA